MIRKNVFIGLTGDDMEALRQARVVSRKGSPVVGRKKSLCSGCGVERMYVVLKCDYCGGGDIKLRVIR